MLTRGFGASSASGAASADRRRGFAAAQSRLLPSNDLG
ncbi:MAG: hypothetical protein AVDCRST_MAG39-1545 [uncultured Sphingomonadaceae bacterium]|uniref:Uncharacterized protein n=1 Tax=uncultured Sphingomonadaceae bacterium TaxID=169976 RepID=A0A6J4SSF5_9SPHN|nr:MAG: hypothetical protein AVDCRST_MAG39-1545 [uncultured Sphingomonadaceae bacterium]